ncbi:DinB family protein [Trebonia kvetii]|uniref:DinB family protein n=1 Tax=Trebonia kvetii TaxID=2480626 RepID=A0A6P2C3A6_9ACTN|nr:DinB family protein [Trebonia kvetii]TVZ04966.1 DinB family protein [Trebonia kvetii]
MAWTAPDIERSEHYPERRNEPELEMLRDWLDWHRATLLRKCAGLDAAQLATRAVPPSNLSLLGLVRHMSDTERGWVRQTYRAEQAPDLYYRADAPDADFAEADPAAAEEDFERYLAECRAVDAALEGAELDETFTLGEKTISVRWMWQHLVEEYARHNGHADLIREVIDGSTGL